MNRAILRELQNPLAEAILAGGYAGGETVHVDSADGKNELQFSISPSAVSPPLSPAVSPPPLSPPVSKART